MSNKIIINDLRQPQLNEEQLAVIALGEQLPLNFTSTSILEDAIQITGFDDFGNPDFIERLNLLVDEWSNDKNLYAIAQYSLRSKLLLYARSRLLIQDRLKKHPEILEEEIIKPIIVAGLPRSGTTHLLNLLAADKNSRALPLWESYEPVPMPDEKLLDDGTDARYKRCNDHWQMMQKMTPHLAAMHPMNPDHIHEELELMGPDFASYNFEWLSMSPRWRDDYLSKDQTNHYAYMKTVLKLLQWQDKQRGLGKKRWVLKCPQHLEQLPVLKNTFPDATLVVTHRDPVAVIQSTITMLAYGQRMSRKQVEIDQLARYWVDRIQLLLQACVRDRHIWSESQSIDVLFHEFMRDDMAMIKRIYTKAEIPLDATTEADLNRYIDNHPRGKHGQVVYNLKKDFDISPHELRKTFTFYAERFAVKAE